MSENPSAAPSDLTTDPDFTRRHDEAWKRGISVIDGISAVFGPATATVVRETLDMFDGVTFHEITRLRRTLAVAPRREARRPVEDQLDPALLRLFNEVPHAVEVVRLVAGEMLELYGGDADVAH